MSNPKTDHMFRKTILPVLVLLILIGVGYFWWKSTPPPAVQAPSPAVKTQADENKPKVITGTEMAERRAIEAQKTVIEQPKAATPTSTLFTVDDTWQTYTNKSLGFDFRWPTKGIYAPTWEQKTLKNDDQLIKESCAADGGAFATGGYQGYCHSFSTVEVTSNESRVDQYIWKKGGNYIAIIFTKNLYKVSGCKSISLSKSSCVEFKPETYQALLDTSISTLKFNEQ
jgi:hypothetical protein